MASKKTYGQSQNKLPQGNIMMRQIISASQIDQWFTPTRRDAQDLLPHLVRKLIAATVPVNQLQGVRVPAGDQIGKPGFDGIVSVASESPFIPKGQSAWEMGVGGDAKSKADDDYNKRTRNTQKGLRKSITFVFVTPRVWAGKKNSGENWARDKCNSKQWKAIRVLDATDLETWLEACPAVARWLARQMGIPLRGFRDVVGYIKEEFEARHGVSWSPDLMIGGRMKSARTVTDWLIDERGVLKVRGESVEEAALFIASCIWQLKGDAHEATANRCVFVNDPDALDHLTGLGTQQIVVALNHDVRRRAISLNAPSIRLIAVDGRRAGLRPDSWDIELERIKRKACEEALVALGVGKSRASRAARDSKGSLTALLWSIETEDNEPLPWAGAEAGHALAPVLLAGQWVTESESDRNAVGKLAGVSYDQLKSGPLIRWREPQGPLIHRAGVWDWMAWDFAWALLGCHIDADQVRRFEDVVSEVLAEPDPRYELDSDKRWLANIYGKVRKHSEALIGGLVGSIAQFAVNADAGTCPQGKDVASRIVRQLLIPDKDRGLRWMSLAKWLPDLAEAAPEMFLEATESLVNDTEATQKIFEEERGGVFAHSMHPYLLWALERLAWSPEYLSRTTLMLGRLDALDPGGQLGNRPKNSLFAIYFPWHPNTGASAERRMNAIRALYDRCPGEGWQLGIRLLPKSHDIVMPTAMPRWRQWKPDTDVKVTNPEYWQFIESLVATLLGWVEGDDSRWAELLEQLPEIQRKHPELGDRMASALEAVDANAMAASARNSVATQLREMLTRHRQFPDAEWVLDTAVINRLQALYERFAPNDLVQKKGWLFKSSPELPERYADTHEEYEARLLAERRSLVEEIYTTEGLAGVRRLAEASEQPEEVGSVIALLETNDDRICELLVEGLSLIPTKHHYPMQLNLAWGVVRRRFKDKGLAWIREQGARLRNDIGDQGLANLALPIPAAGPVWDVVDGWGGGVAIVYWERVGVHYLSDANRDLGRAIHQLLRVGRPYRAIDVLGMSLRRIKKKEGGETLDLPIDQKEVISLLQEAPKKLPNDEWHPTSMSMVSYAVQELLQWLEDVGVGDDSLALLEWIWMGALEHGSRGMVVLQRCLSTDPKLFVDLLKLLFHTEGEEPVEVTDEQRARATHAHRLLNNWSVVPGTVRMKVDGSDKEAVRIDQDLLQRWVTEARRLAAECGRLRECDVQFGEVLAHAPCDNDGTWPCEAVRNVIEKVSSRDLDHGVHCGEMNKRGAHFRKSGGDQEREIATKYRSYRDQVIDRWPRTGAILDGIRLSYEGQAKWHDERDDFEEFAD